MSTAFTWKLNHPQEYTFFFFFFGCAGLRWGTWGSLLQRRLSLVAVSRGYTLVVVHGLLIVLASFVAEHPCPLH